jgi:hypothetical protein
VATPADRFDDASGIARFQGSIVGTAGPVLSVFGRAGNVVATTGDYTAVEVGAIPDSANAVTTTLINAKAVTTAKIDDLAVAAGQLAANAVTTAKILNANVTLPKLAGNLPYLFVQSEPPTVLTSPIVLDDTAVTGGVYAWDGAAYQQVAGPLA